jgi:hypothetical protein
MVGGMDRMSNLTKPSGKLCDSLEHRRPGPAFFASGCDPPIAAVYGAQPTVTAWVAGQIRAVHAISMPSSHVLHISCTYARCSAA